MIAVRVCIIRCRLFVVLLFLHVPFPCVVARLLCFFFSFSFGRHVFVVVMLFVSFLSTVQLLLLLLLLSLRCRGGVFVCPIARL